MKWQKAGETFVRYKYVANENVCLQLKATVLSRIEETNFSETWTHELETKSETDEHFISTTTAFQFVFLKTSLSGQNLFCDRRRHRNLFPALRRHLDGLGVAANHRYLKCQKILVEKSRREATKTNIFGVEKSSLFRSSRCRRSAESCRPITSSSSPASRSRATRTCPAGRPPRPIR